MRTALLAGVAAAGLAFLAPACAHAPLECDPLIVDLYDVPQGGTLAVFSCGVECKAWECQTEPKSRMVTCRCDGKALARGAAWEVQ